MIKIEKVIAVMPSETVNETFHSAIFPPKDPAIAASASGQLHGDARNVSHARVAIAGKQQREMSH